MTMVSRWTNSHRVMLDDDLSSFVTDASAAEGISGSALIRRAVALLRASEQRRAPIDEEGTHDDYA